LSNALELRVIGDEGFDPAGVVVRETEAAAKFVGHADRRRRGCPAATAGFAGGANAEARDVAEQDSPKPCRDTPRGRPFERESVDPDIAFGM
jgi:hypothetical protein